MTVTIPVVRTECGTETAQGEEQDSEGEVDSEE